MVFHTMSFPAFSCLAFSASPLIGLYRIVSYRFEVLRLKSSSAYSNEVRLYRQVVTLHVDRTGINRVSSVILHRRYSSHRPVDATPSKPNPINYGRFDRIWYYSTSARCDSATKCHAAINTSLRIDDATSFLISDHCRRWKRIRDQTPRTIHSARQKRSSDFFLGNKELECGPMPNVMAALRI